MPGTHDGADAVRVVLADAEPIFAAGLAAVLAGRGVRAEVVDPDAFPDCALGSDAAVVDSRLGRLPYAADHVELLAAVGVPVLVVADRVRPAGLAEALAAGARGVVHRQCSADELLAAVSSVIAGETWVSAPVAHLLREELTASGPGAHAQELTRRELEVLRALARGGGNSEIGRRLGISANTVRNHLHTVMAKLGAANRTDALAIAVRRGWVDLDRPG